MGLRTAILAGAALPLLERVPPEQACLLLVPHKHMLTLTVIDHPQLRQSLLLPSIEEYRKGLDLPIKEICNTLEGPSRARLCQS